MNEKNRHVSVPQPLPANFGPPVPPVGPGPGQVVGQQPWVGQPPWPPHQGFPPFKNNSSYPPTMHPGGYNILRFPNYDQCQNFQFGKIHEGPTTYSAIRHYESHPFNNDVPKESPLPKSSIDLFPQNKSPGHAVQKEKNGRDEAPSSPSDSKSDSETNNTTTESCPDDTRSPISCDKQDSFFVDKNGENSMKSISDSNSHLEADILHKKNRNNADAQTFSSSISNSNNHHAKKDNAMLHYEARFHNQPSYRHGEGMYGSYPEGRMLNNIPPHELADNVNFGYRHQRRNSLNDIEKLTDGNFSDKRGASENVFQVPSISSTTPPKIFPPIPHESWDDSKYYQQQDEDGDKVPRKKRKRCGECPGCLQKQNCGRCGPCRSVRSHQICKMRKCESLKTKKEKAAEESVKAGGGRRSKDLDHSRNSIDKVNGNSSSPAMIPTPRSHMDQYQPQGGSHYQPPVNSYNPPTQYGSFTPPQHMQMFDSRVPAVDSPVDLDSSNSAHQMANTRLKTLIHNRQNQRDQLMPICNPLQEPPYGASVPLSPGSQSYRPPFLPPLNHQENSMQYSSSSESALMHLQQLSPNSISPQKSQNCVPWSEGDHKTPESIQTLTQKSPLKSSLQNGHATHEETKMVNGCHSKPDSSSVSNNCALDNNNSSSSSESSVTQNGHAVMKNSGVENEVSKPDIKPFITPEKSQTPIENGASHLLPLAPRLSNSGFPSPSFAYRHVAPLHNFSPNILQGCLPPPPMAQPVTASENGERVTPLNSTTTPDANCSENSSTTQSPPFLLNTTTSMNTFISTTNTYNSKLSFSNATCLPTYASTSVSNSSHMYINSYNSHQMYFSSYSDHKPSLYPPGGGRPSKPCIDSGRIHSDMYTSDFVPDFGHYHQDLPPYPSSYTHPLPSSPPKITGGDDPGEKLERLRTNTKLDPPQCDCLRNKEVMPSEKMPYYTHLGSGASVSAIRELIECRSGEKGDAIRIEKLVCVGKEGRTSQGCPLAKWVIRRSGPEEKLLTVVRHRTGHSCPTAYIVVALVAWEGVPQSMANTLYSTVVQKTLQYGIPTQRKCATNEMRTCACQGLDPETCGASFSFGCSWSMYYNGCKFARSKNARKFKLTEKEEEQELEDKLQNLATDVSSLYRKIAPESFENQTAFETEASDCRLGRFSGRPFSGVTACIDYCAHAHKDLHNMNNGCTVVVTLTKHRGFDKPESEQLHVLPLYTIDTTDEWGNSQQQKITAGALEVLDKYSTDFMVRTTPLKPCKTRGRKPKDGLSPRRMALQATFRQLIASGKLRRIDRGGETTMGNSNQNYNVTQQYSKLPYNSTYVCNDGNNNCLSTHVPDNSNKRLYDDDDDNYYHYPSYDSTSFYRQYEYGTKASSLPLKIPGNCSASTMHAMQFSADKASHCGSYTMPNHSNYNTNNNFVDTPPPASYTKKTSPYSELESDSVYALQDLDSKSINCFFKKEHEYADSPTSDQINNNSHLQPKSQLCELNNNNGSQSKYELPPKRHLCEVDNTNPIQSKFDTQPQCEVNNNNYLSQHYNQPPVYNYHHLAKNYNFHLQQSNSLFYSPPDQEVDSTTLEGDEVYEGHSDNESCFRDPEVGGVAIALTHGSVLFECAKHELHATTAVRKPDRANPTRISLVFYQHKNLNRKGHGGEEWEQKKKPRVQGTGWTMFPMSPLAVG